MAPTPNKPKSKQAGPRLSEAEEVAAFMTQLEHPLKAEIEAVRSIIKASPELAERIKWKAPSYYYKGVDLLTFNPRLLTRVHLVFHHEAITRVKSDLLEGEYKDRRMMYFTDIAEVRNKKPELEKIMAEYLAAV